jgi:succinate dehydrogenase/fumarate reductase flavoprotein subunit
MEARSILLDGTRFPLYAVNTLVIGSGAAALNAALALHDRGQRDVLIVTEAWGGGTSANAGSDKQTYYKLSTAGGAADSAREMAADLAAGGCMHGDIALCEAQHSLQAFYHLVQLGVPFPHNAYGAFVGYRTDHDPRGRATSAGPLTSRLMVEALARDVSAKNVRVLDRHQVVALLVDRREAEPNVAGAVALVPGEAGDGAPRLVLCSAVNVVLATGGPGGMYADSVYPPGQTGSIGLALQAGAFAQNLTESQFGLASIGFRWNVSGSYQQAIPRYVSTGADGGDDRDFLDEAFPDMATLATAIFRKGYEWPFDPRRVDRQGSSLIDLLVHRERVVRGRRVFLDYTRNPAGGERLGPFSLDALSAEARDYLRHCGALAPTPIERLRRINAPAIDLYRGHGIDLERDRLEIAVCAQHNNGGLVGNHWWESNVKGLFPVGEVNGSHGVLRPGGAALNAGQVGGLRAAMYIARRRRGAAPGEDALLEACGEQIREIVATAERALSGGDSDHADEDDRRGRACPARRRQSVEDVRREIQNRMTRNGAHIRTRDGVREATGEAWALYEQLRTEPHARSIAELPDVFRNLDLALAHAVYLEAIGEYLAQGGQSRGSYIVVDRGGTLSCPALGDPPALAQASRELRRGLAEAPSVRPATAGEWRFDLNRPGAFVDEHILEISIDPLASPPITQRGAAGPASTASDSVRKRWVKVRPIPEPGTWFETVWRAYREDEVIR